MSTGGFSAGLDLDVDGTKTHAVSGSRTSSASHITAGNNINITTGSGDTRTLIGGSTLSAGNAIDVDTGTLDIRASEDTSHSTSNKKHINAHASVGLVGTAGFSASLSGDNTDASSSQTAHTNSALNAQKIHLSSRNDTHIKGANIHGTQETTLNVGGDLKIASVRERSKERSRTIGASLSTDGSGGINGAKSDSRIKSTLLTSLTGGKVDIKVKGKTHVKGALVAAGKVDKEGTFIDNGKLTIDTKSLSTSDLSNRVDSTDMAAGVNVGSATTSVQYHNDREHIKSKTMATIGKGQVTVNGKDAKLPSNLNRDTARMDKDIYHVNQTQGNIDATLDNRLLTPDGHKSIAEDIERNVRTVRAVGDVIGKDAFGAGDLIDHIDEVQKDLDVQKAFALEGDGKYIEALSDGTPEQKQEAINAYAQIYADTYGISIDEAKVIATNKFIKGATYNENKHNNKIYINDNAQKRATDYAHTIGHEVTHARINQGAARGRGSHKLNEEYADTMGSYSADGMEFSANTYTSSTRIDQHTVTNTHRGNHNSQLLKTNTKGFIATASSHPDKMDYMTDKEAIQAVADAKANGINLVNAIDPSSPGGHVAVPPEVAMEMATKGQNNLSDEDIALALSTTDNTETAKQVIEYAGYVTIAGVARKVVIVGGKTLIKKGGKFVRASREEAGEVGKKIPEPSTLHTRGVRIDGGRKISETIKGSNKIKNANGEVFKRVDFAPSKPHNGLSPHTHPNFRNELPDGTIRSGVSRSANPVNRRDIIDATRENKQRTGK